MILENQNLSLAASLEWFGLFRYEAMISKDVSQKYKSISRENNATTRLTSLALASTHDSNEKRQAFLYGSSVFRQKGLSSLLSSLEEGVGGI